MSTSAISPGVGSRVEMHKELPPGRYGMSGLLRSEWTKLRTVRSTMWTLGVTVLLGIGISALGLRRDPCALGDEPRSPTSTRRGPA